MRKSTKLYALLIVAVSGERLAELVVARRNMAWSLSRGGREYGQSHYPPMVALHTGLLAGSLIETTWARRRFAPSLGWPMLGLAIGAQALRWWCISTLGLQWNTRVVVVPGSGLVEGGPYRWFRHPNYVAVVVEGAALPLVHGAWATAAGFTALNSVLLRTRIRVENAALRECTEPEPDDA